MSRIEIPFIKPHLPHSAELAVDYEAIVESNWFTNFGPFENRFRQAASEYLDNGTYVTTVVNATLGLDIAIRALVDKETQKKSIIMPSFTFAAGAEAIVANGLVPVFIDINKDDLQPNIEEARAYIMDNRDNVAGILLCNIFGVGNRSIGDWEDLAEEFTLPLIIDTAAGFGSRYDKDEKVGARGDCEVFSLHATKPFSVGEGGLVASRNMHLIEKIRMLQNFGFGSDKRIAAIGTNAKMQEINAAIGLRQLSEFEQRLKGRRMVLGMYKDQLTGCQYQDNDDLSTVAFASIVTTDASKSQRVYRRLRENGIEVRRYYDPLHLQKEVAKHSLKASDLRVTEDIASRILSLPVHDNMNNDSIKRIIESIQTTH